MTLMYNTEMIVLDYDEINDLKQLHLQSSVLSNVAFGFGTHRLANILNKKNTFYIP